MKYPTSSTIMIRCMMHELAAEGYSSSSLPKYSFVFTLVYVLLLFHTFSFCSVRTTLLSSSILLSKRHFITCVHFICTNPPSVLSLSLSLPSSSEQVVTKLHFQWCLVQKNIALQFRRDIVIYNRPRDVLVLSISKVGGEI